MINCLYVMIGGAIGALMRYGVSRLLAGISIMSLPTGTFCVNIAGCFLLGFLTGIGEQHTSIPRQVMLMLTVGLCGSFTTFSTFTSETLKAMENGEIVSSIVYVTASIVIGLLLFYLGKLIAGNL